jgi:hypothetical protein
MRRMADVALRGLSRRFDAMYPKCGRPSIAPEKLLRALLLTCPLNPPNPEYQYLPEPRRPVATLLEIDTGPPLNS